MNPRFKTKFVNDGHDALLGEVCCVAGSSVEEVEKCPEETTDSNLRKSRSDRPHQDLWSCFDEIVSSNNKTLNPRESVKQEIDTFLALCPQPMKVCPYAWWNEKKHVYSNVFKVMLKYLSSPNSSVYSKRDITEAGNISMEKSATQSAIFCFHTITYAT